MDEAVKPMLTLPRRALVLASLLSLCAGACAQALQDPTRPPALAAGAAAASSATAAGPQLQTILIGRGQGGRHLAVIDGETVRPGDAFRGARVARIGEDEVELVRGRERQVLRLYGADAPKGGMTPAARQPALAQADKR
jgi:MSHA biogenesis protein MshK